MPWPTNSRTTENPYASTCCCTAWPMSETRCPGRARSIALYSDSSVTRSSVAASSDTCPTGSVIALSPKYPSSDAPTSIEMMSPSFSTRRPDGIPWITSSLIDAQIVAGIPVIPLERRRRPGLPDPLLRQLVQVGRAHAGRDRAPTAPSAPRRPAARPRASARARRPTGRRSPRVPPLAAFRRRCRRPRSPPPDRPPRDRAPARR